MKQNGFSLVEVILAIALAAIFIPAIGALLSFSIFTTSQGKLQTQAYTLAQEGMEAVFSLKARQNADWNWTSTPVFDKVYQPFFNGTDWQLGPIVTIPTITQAPFTRTVTISSVSACSYCSINPQKRLVTVLVSWPEKGQTQQVTLDAYVTQH